MNHRIRVGVLTFLSLAALAWGALARPDGREIDMEGSVISGSLAQGDRFCAIDGCHDSEVDSTFNDRADLELVNWPQTFQAGQSFQPSFVIDGPASTRVYGFQLAALYQDGTQAGTLQALTPGSLVHPVEGFQILLHAPQPLKDDEVRFRWIAPAQPKGDVIIRVAANAANDNNDPSRDHIVVKETLVVAENVVPPPPVEESFFAQVGDGTVGVIRFRTSIILVNNGPDATASLDFFQSDGQPMTIDLGALGSASSFEIPLAAGQAFSAQSSGSAGLLVGYARLQAPAGVGGTAVFTRSDAVSGINLFETGIPSSSPTTSFSLFADQVGTRRTGVAMVNTGQAEATITLRLFDKNSVEKAPFKTIQLAPGNHQASFVDEIFPDRDPDFSEGVMTAVSDQPLAAVTLRQGEDEPGLEFPQEVPLLTAFPVIVTPAEPVATGSALRRSDQRIEVRLRLPEDAVSVLFSFYRGPRLLGVEALDCRGLSHLSRVIEGYPTSDSVTTRVILKNGLLGRENRLRLP